MQDSTENNGHLPPFVCLWPVASDGDGITENGDAAIDTGDAPEENGDANVPTSTGGTTSSQAPPRPSSPGKTGARGHVHSGASASPATTPPLLDRRAIPWELTHKLWPILAPHVGSKMKLMMVNVTVPEGHGIRAPAATFARQVAESSPGAAALLALEPSGNATEHLHGLVLCEQPDGLIPARLDLVGGVERANKVIPVTGWADHVAGKFSKLVGNVAHVVNYAFKPWPDGHGERDLHDDVFASGPFSFAWSDTLAALKIPFAQPLTSTCPWCEKPVSKRQTWCGDGHRKAADKQRHRLGMSMSENRPLGWLVVRALLRRYGGRPFTFEKVRRLGAAFGGHRHEVRQLLHEFVEEDGLPLRDEKGNGLYRLNLPK